MRPKFNKDLQRWGVWIEAGETFSVWLSSIDTDEIPGKPLTFQSKQEAQRYINEISL